MRPNPLSILPESHGFMKVGEIRLYIITAYARMNHDVGFLSRIRCYLEGLHEQQVLSEDELVVLAHAYMYAQRRGRLAAILRRMCRSSGDAIVGDLEELYRSDQKNLGTIRAGLLYAGRVFLVFMSLLHDFPARAGRRTRSS
jgi:hypothetical protein